MGSVNWELGSGAAASVSRWDEHLNAGHSSAAEGLTDGRSSQGATELSLGAPLTHPPLTHPLRLLIADHAPTRLGIRMALGPEVEVCSEASDGEQAIRAAKRDQPDICLVGREITGDGLGAVRGICRAAPHAAVVVLAEVADPDDLLESARAGAVGYVPGTLDGDRLRKIIRAVASNEAVVPRSMVLDLILELRGAGTRDDGLTGRESQVLGMVRRGHTTAAIAERLEIAPVTVRRHISELVHKLGVADRSALTAAARLNGNGGSRLHAQD
jgi:DNA-binding NarL/FixJ family response regulator